MTMLKDAVLWLYWYPFRLFAQKIPTKSAYAIAKIAGLLLYYINYKKQRELKEILSDVSAGLIKEKNFNKILRNSFVIYCQNELEVLLFSHLNRDNIQEFVKCSGLENLDKALEGGKGALLLFAHFGANQMIMPAIGYNGYKMSQMSAPATVWIEKLPNKKFSSMEKHALELRWAQEKSLPVTHINIFGSLKKIFICLKRNEVLGIAIDGGGGKDRIKIKFMNKPALFSSGAAALAVRTKCIVLPTFMVRTKDGKSEMRILDPIHPPIGVPEEFAIQTITQDFTDLMTQFVVEYPDHYLNFLLLRRRMGRLGDTPLFVEEEGRIQ